MVYDGIKFKRNQGYLTFQQEWNGIWELLRRIEKGDESNFSRIASNAVVSLNGIKIWKRMTDDEKRVMIEKLMIDSDRKKFLLRMATNS
jgi:hypothetical protein